MDINSWIKWEGGECPIDNDKIISIRYRNRRVVKGLIDANWLDWTHNGNIDDIVEYMIENP